MVSVSTRKRDGSRRVLYRATNGQRRAITVGYVPLLVAREISGHIQHLVMCQRSDSEVRASTRCWIDQIKSTWPELSKRLAAHRLINPVLPEMTFKAFAEGLLANRTDLRPNSRNLWKQTIRRIDEYFQQRRLSGLTAADGTEFLRWLARPVAAGGAGHSATTPSKHFSISRQFLNRAVEAGHLEANPFGRIRASQGLNKDRQHFVPPDIVRSVMAVTDNLELRAIIALSRWGGLRTPSEPFALLWKHIDFARRRIWVPAVKTKQRQIPLFPELHEPLQSLRDHMESIVSDTPVFRTLNRYSDSNLRKQFTKLIRSAGLTVWPKVFHNLRSSRQTELEESFPRHTVCAWMGNSETVADRHYLQVLERHFETATMDNGSRP